MHDSEKANINSLCKTKVVSHPKEKQTNTNLDESININISVMDRTSTTDKEDLN